MSRTRRQFTGKEKVVALKRHLVEGTPVSDLCDELGIRPSQFYTWQKRFFEHGETAFANGERKTKSAQDAAAARIAALEAKLRRKDEVLGELMEEHVALKKSLGEV
jgi:transposase-like protein